MEITGYELYTVPPRWVFLKLETDTDVVGWGEPIVEGRVKTTRAAVSELINDYILGSDPTEVNKLWYRMFHGDHYRSGPLLMSAIAGIDQALWDIAGKMYGRPVYELLGGPVRRKVRAYKWISGDHAEELAETALQAIDQGYTAIGMMAHTRPARVRMSEIVTEVDERVRTVRDVIGNQIDLAVDFRGRVTTGIAKRLLSALEDYNLVFVEEPVLPEYNNELPRLSASTAIPLATGQRMYSRWQFKNHLENGAIQIAQPAISHAGGITEVMKIGTIAEAYNVMLMPKCSVGPVAFAASMHVQMAAQNAVLQEQHDEFYAEQNNQFFNYIENEDLFTLSEGFLRIASEPGLGVEMDEDYIRQQSRKNTEWKGPVWHNEDGSVANW